MKGSDMSTVKRQDGREQDRPDSDAAVGLKGEAARAHRAASLTNWEEALAHVRGRLLWFNG